MSKCGPTHHKGCECHEAQRDEKLRIAVEALEQLLEAHKLLFRSSLFSAFTAGDSNFSRAWKQAEEALAKIQGEK